MISGASAQKCASARLSQCHWTALLFFVVFSQHLIHPINLIPYPDSLILGGIKERIEANVTDCHKQKRSENFIYVHYLVTIIQHHVDIAWQTTDDKGQWYDYHCIDGVSFHTSFLHRFRVAGWLLTGWTTTLWAWRRTTASICYRSKTKTNIEQQQRR